MELMRKSKEAVGRWLMRFREASTMAVVILVAGLCVGGCGSSSEHKISPDGSVQMDLDFFHSARLAAIPRAVDSALTEFGQANGIATARARGRAIYLGPEIGRVWMVELGEFICIVGGPDSSNSVGCFKRDDVYLGRGFTALLSASGGSTKVTAFGLVPPRNLRVSLAGPQHADRCIVVTGAFSCRGQGARVVTFTQTNGHTIVTKLPTPGQ